MKNIMAWIIGRTKVGTISKTVQSALDGKKQTIASFVAAIVASSTILMNYSEHGIPYLMQVASTPEFATASVGWIGFFNSLKGEKIRKENAVIIENQQTVIDQGKSAK